MIHRLLALAPVVFTGVSLLTLPAAHAQDVKLPPTMTFTVDNWSTPRVLTMTSTGVQGTGAVVLCKALFGFRFSLNRLSIEWLQ